MLEHLWSSLPSTNLISLPKCCRFAHEHKQHIPALPFLLIPLSSAHVALPAVSHIHELQLRWVALIQSMPGAKPKTHHLLQYPWCPWTSVELGCNTSAFIGKLVSAYTFYITIIYALIIKKVCLWNSRVSVSSSLLPGGSFLTECWECTPFGKMENNTVELKKHCGSQDHISACSWRVACNETCWCNLIG